MASGLPHAQWNSGDVTDVDAMDLGVVRAWYSARAGGAGVPWGLRVPADTHFPHGRWLFRHRCMALLPSRHRHEALPPRVDVRVATPGEVDVLAAIDATAFGDPLDQTRAWVDPQPGAPGFTVALATLDGEAVGVATAVQTDDRAGPSVGIFGVAVIERGRRHGIGGAMTSWLLARAFAGGATLAHINPNTDDAARVYARLGFVETPGFNIYVDL